MFEVGLTNDAGFAVRAAAVVAAGKLVDSQHLCPALCQMIGRRAAHAAGAKDDDVVVCHGASYSKSSGSTSTTHWTPSIGSRFSMTLRTAPRSFSPSGLLIST